MTEAGKPTTSRRRQGSTRRRGSGGYDDLQLGSNSEEEPHRRHSSLSSLHSHSSQTFAADQETDRKDRLRCGSVASSSRRDRDQIREREHLHHRDHDQPASSAAERRAVYSRTREHRERRVLEHVRPKPLHHNSSAAVSSETLNDIDCPEGRHSHLSGRKAVSDDDANSGYSTTRDARGRREQVEAELQEAVGHSSTSFSRSSVSVREGRHRRDQSYENADMDQQESHGSCASPSGGWDVRHRRACDGGSPDNDGSVFALPRTSARERSRRDRSIEDNDDGATTFTSRAIAVREGRNRRDRSAVDPSLDHEEEIERIREMRARRLRGERAAEREQQQHRDRDDTSVHRHHSTDYDGNDLLTEERRNRAIMSSLPMPNYGRRERESRRSSDKQSPSEVAPYRSQPSNPRKKLDDSGLVRRDRQSRRGGRELSPRSSSRSAPTVGTNSSSQPSYHRIRREDALVGSTRDNLVAMGARLDFRRERENHHPRDRGKNRDQVTQSPGDRLSDGSRCDTRRVSRDREPLPDQPSPRLWPINRDVGDFGESMARRDAIGNPAPLKPSADRGTAVAAVNRVSKLPESDHPDRSAATQIRSRERTNHRERERRLPIRSNTAEDLRIATGDLTRERSLPLRAKSADGNLLAMELNRVRDSGFDTERIGFKSDLSIQSNLTQEQDLRWFNRSAGSNNKILRGLGVVRSKSGDTVNTLRDRREADRERAMVASSVEGGQIVDGSLSFDVDRDSLHPRSNDDKAGCDEPDAMTTPQSAAQSRSSQIDISPGRTGLADDAKVNDGIDRITELEFSSDEETMSHPEQWSVRVCVISAVDLPLNVVRNMPLCPVLKFGLVKIPDREAYAIGDDENGVAPGQSVLETLANRKIDSIKTARIRTTECKILSKRDNGAVDFQQEMRWDGVKHPMRAGLYVELSARAVRTPENFQESPKACDELQRPDSATAEQSSETSVALHGSGSTPNLRAEESGPARGVQRHRSGSDDELTNQGGGLRALWRKATNRKAAELEAANAAAAVARMLVEQDGLSETGMDANASRSRGNRLLEKASFSQTSGPVRVDSTRSVPCPSYNVALRSAFNYRRGEMTQNVRLGNLLIPFTDLPLDRATNGNEAATVEQWYQLKEVDEHLAYMRQSTSRKKMPSILLRISFSSLQILDNLEDIMEGDSNPGNDPLCCESNQMPESKPVREHEMASGKHDEEKPHEEPKVENPILQPGVIDFVSVVGAKDFGSQRNDSGSDGWVSSTPKCGLLEQFPATDESHRRMGRNVSLPNMVEWFCFPEGIRLWRGFSPPSHSDLNLKRYSGASPPNTASSIAAFDACLNCTTSFLWFVIASNSDEYGSKVAKTYGAVIRFYVPVPARVFGDSNTSKGEKLVSAGFESGSRIWVPIGICLTSSLPIVGVMEVILLRLCEELSTAFGRVDRHYSTPVLDSVHKSLWDFVFRFQKPIAGTVNCSVPFLSGERYLLSLPPPTGLPSLPHGHCVVSVCRLLGADGLNFLLSAVLTECKIIIHSDDLADIAMVAEVITALAYPFSWSLPYIPILPIDMLEFVEAPLSYIVGIPTPSLRLVNPKTLEDVVVVDLNKEGSSADFFESRRSGMGNKSPSPLPANASSNISKAVFRLLRAEKDVDDLVSGKCLAVQTFPRLDGESLAEREFRITVAIQICGLLRGFQDCIGPVFNRDRFLKEAPALFEETLDSTGSATAKVNRRGQMGSVSSQNRVYCPRSKRFLSLLVNTQNFHQLLESLESDDAAFFHEIMEAFDDSIGDGNPTRGSLDIVASIDRTLAQLTKAVQKIEDNISTYRVSSSCDWYASSSTLDIEHGLISDLSASSLEHMQRVCYNSHCFTSQLLALPDKMSTRGGEASDDEDKDPESLDFLSDAGKSSWTYRELLSIPHGSACSMAEESNDSVSLRDAIGERRYRVWKMAQDQKLVSEVDYRVLSQEISLSKEGIVLDLTSLVSSATDDGCDVPGMSAFDLGSQALSPEQQLVMDARNRDVIRRCLDKANGSSASRYGNPSCEGTQNDSFVENGRDLIAEAEKALKNFSAQRFLLSILSQRSRLESQRSGRHLRRQSAVASQSSVSRLEPPAFDCLIRLSCAMLDACMELREYVIAYRLLTHTAGFIMVQQAEEFEENERDHGTKQIITMTSRIGLHPIFADLSVWTNVMQLHLEERQTEKRCDTDCGFEPQGGDCSGDVGSTVYEAAVATLYEMLGYGIPGEELSRFASLASEENGWFSDDRGKQLLMLARRITLRREQTDNGAAGGAGDIDMIRRRNDSTAGRNIGASDVEYEIRKLSDIGWCHPAAPTSQSFVRNCDLSSDSAYLKRSPITSLAPFGTSVVVTGGLDGSVFLAHSISGLEGSEPSVHGIHLDWGSASRASSGSSSDGEYGVGAVSCLAAAFGSGCHGAIKSSVSSSCMNMSDEELVESMEGNRVVAGTTAGDLRVWSVKDVYSAVMLTKNGEDNQGDSLGSIGGNAATRLKFSLRGRALSGHRGGVTCIDVPSHVYRPDALVTGGADGLVKLWSLRAPTGGRRTNTGVADGETVSSQRGRGGDALTILTGHSGRILCINTAWHGDRLLSGAADRSIRIWDLAGSSGKCFHTLSGHTGWVTKVQFWGPNTVVSASTDRSVALWDARVRSSPLFVLRHHHSSISDLLVGSRTEPLMVSAGADGTIATWDFRSLSGSSNSSDESTLSRKPNGRKCTVVRTPSATMDRCLGISGAHCSGSVLLARGMVNASMNTVFSVDPDAVIREWDIATGALLDATPTGHCDAVSSFSSYGRGDLSLASALDPLGETTITSSWDGTVRMRRITREQTSKSTAE